MNLVRMKFGKRTYPQREREREGERDTETDIQQTETKIDSVHHKYQSADTETNSGPHYW